MRVTGIGRREMLGGAALDVAPVADIARDRRWGRVADGAGEDVLLNRVMAAARVRDYPLRRS